MLMHFWHWLAIHTGSENEPGIYYGFWSGFGSDIGEVAILGGVLGVFKHHNCHVKRCWRLGRFAVAGTPYKVCHRHHPEFDKKPTVEDVVKAHRIAQL